ETSWRRGTYTETNALLSYFAPPPSSLAVPHPPCSGSGRAVSPNQRRLSEDLHGCRRSGFWEVHHRHDRSLPFLTDYFFLFGDQPLLPSGIRCTEVLIVPERPSRELYGRLKPT
ncbi:hypothetical protein EJB05_02928, partial [Eragrostis curvula]